MPVLPKPPLPTEFMLDAGNLCNLRCPFCPTGLNLSGMSQGLMSLGTFELVLEKISPYAHDLHMMNWGEPLLNPHILQMISLAAGAGIRTGFDSNLSFRDFDEAEAETIVRSGVWRIQASIDGASQETYAEYRRRGNFDRALQNLGVLRRVRDQLGSSTPTLDWQFLINGKNCHEMEAAKAMAAELGVGIVFHLMATWGAEGWRSPFHDLAEAGEFNDNDWYFPAPAMGQKLFFTPKPWTTDRRDATAKQELPAEVPGVCQQPFNRMIINWDGKVLPCCVCYGDHFFLGDLLTQSIEEIWWGEGLQASRRFLSNYGPKQQTQSVCETGACAVSKKYFGEPDSEIAKRYALTFSKKQQDRAAEAR